MSGPGWRHAARAVFAKEIVDALRDRRTLLVVLLSSVLLGPLVLVALSGLVATLEARRDLCTTKLAWASGIVVATKLPDTKGREEA